MGKLRLSKRSWALLPGVPPGKRIFPFLPRYPTPFLHFLSESMLLGTQAKTISEFDLSC